MNTQLLIVSLISLAFIFPMTTADSKESKSHESKESKESKEGKDSKESKESHSHESKEHSTKESSNSKLAGPGSSSCGYFGSIDSKCKFEETPVSGLPKECSSIFYQSLTIDESHSVSGLKSDSSLSILDTLLKAKSQPVYAHVGHVSHEQWITVLDNKGTGGEAEAKGMETFFKAHSGITGIVLENIDVFKVNGDFATFSSNVQLYVKALKTTNSGLQVGIQLSSVSIQKSSESQNGIDFTSLNSVFDYYIVQYTTDLNECTKETRIGGTITEASMNKIGTFLTTAKVDKTKIYFQYQVTASTPKSQETIIPCLLSPSQICQDPESTKDYCAETSTSLSQKGKFAKQYGAGFIVSDLDMDDPKGDCCGKPFPSFYFLMDGYSGTTPKACDKLDDRK